MMDQQESTSRKLGRKLLEDIEDTIRAEMVRVMSDKGVLRGLDHGVIAGDVARAVANYIAFSWGGVQFYLPMDFLRRQAMIYDEFDGSNHADLARKYGCSVQTVYKYLRAERARRQSRRQQSLFGGGQ